MSESMYREAFTKLPLADAWYVASALAASIVARRVDALCAAALADTRIAESARRSLGQYARHIGSAARIDCARKCRLFGVW